jgi:hypothetical protein
MKGQWFIILKICLREIYLFGSINYLFVLSVMWFPFPFQFYLLYYSTTIPLAFRFLIFVLISEFWRNPAITGPRFLILWLFQNLQRPKSFDSPYIHNQYFIHSIIFLILKLFILNQFLILYCFIILTALSRISIQLIFLCQFDLWWS